MDLLLSTSGRRPIAGLLDVPSFPLNVRDLKQSDVVFETNSVKHIQLQIACHGLPKILGRHIKISEFRCVHRSTCVLMLYCTHPPYRYSNMIYKDFCAIRLTGTLLGVDETRSKTQEGTHELGRGHSRFSVMPPFPHRDTPNFEEERHRASG